MLKRFDQVALLLSRLLIALLFAGGAAQKVAEPEAVATMLTGVGLPGALVWPVAALNALAAVLLIIGVWVGPVAFHLAVYCAVTSYFHWVPDDPWQMSIFVKNWAIAGGCLALMVAGSGRYAMLPD